MKIRKQDFWGHHIFFHKIVDNNRKGRVFIEVAKMLQRKNCQMQNSKSTLVELFGSFLNWWQEKFYHFLRFCLESEEVAWSFQFLLFCWEDCPKHFENFKLNYCFINRSINLIETKIVELFGKTTFFFLESAKNSNDLTKPISDGLLFDVYGYFRRWKQICGFLPEIEILAKRVKIFWNHSFLGKVC